MDKCLELLCDVVNQACNIGGDKLDSMALSSYCDAIVYLSKKGLVEIQGDVIGRRVIAIWKK